ncbi:unnamed protein product [Closterium sp. NIES-65]|nr:unnamed protein product [Closterium sp. NIES-65]
MSLGGTTGDNTRLLRKAPEEEEDDDEEEEEAMQAEGVREVAVASGLEVLYQETPNYRGAAAEADRMIEPRETARHAWRVPDLGVEPVASAAEEAVTEGELKLLAILKIEALEPAELSKASRKQADAGVADVQMMQAGELREGRREMREG